MKLVRNFIFAALGVSLLVPTGCQSFKSMNNTGKDAIVGGTAGGAVGAGIGALLGGGKGTWIGALIGSAIGAGAGAAIGNQIDRQKRELEQELSSVQSQLQNEIDKKENPIVIKEVTDSNNLKAIKVVLGDAILFNTGSSTLSPLADAALSRIAYNLNQNPQSIMTIIGYTDNTGTYEQNMQLSLQRANAVKNYLVSQGVAAGRLTAQGDGWNNPIVSNDTPAGRAQNRRVELYITAGEDMIKNAQYSN